ncbi:diguanylate cyclase [Paracoccus sp. 1_MG-2023]|uniref:diguanylate cyclase n=1 Tax=unclassified Paracoccus (in: a-proteobacteria) TaxID=2688777 RepID=UPI001C088861|nr:MULTISPECIES: diguanylate cyclase [unclassified Paracoccus (in: a-proteobacteria)]MBU2958124.1 diguanylate cyclase [Paracoccus sp. C2R09]MDO6669290.1 diguanylate cyclase [Paracoccus sp. 1_MG-2023]
MTDRPTILIIDDDPANIEICSAALEEEYEVCFALSAAQALEAVHEVRPDLILLDVVMPDMDGYELCRALKDDRQLADIPVIFATGLGDDEAEVRGLTAGAIDFVTKPIRPASLRRRVANHVQMKRMRDSLADQALTDALTGLGNRRMLERKLQSELRRLAREEGTLAVILMDIDHFKRFNDTLGHPEGDRCLRQVGAEIGRCMQRGADFAARYGGEEFACILPDADLEGATHMAETIRARIEALAIAHGASDAGPCVTVSVGVAWGMSEPGLDAEYWLTAADRMLYRSKGSGRNRVSVDGMVAAPPATDAMQDQPRRAMH